MRCAILGPKMFHLPPPPPPPALAQRNYIWKIINIILIYLLVTFIEENFKKFFQQIQSAMAHFPKSVQKPCFSAIFDHFWSFLPDGYFFQKILLCHRQLYMGP